jgi:serine/threonine-protein kinase
MLAVQPTNRFSSADAVLQAINSSPVTNPVPPTISPVPTILPTTPLSQTTEVSSLLNRSSYQPSTAASQPPIGASFQPEPTNTTASGLKDWQKAGITGGVIGVCLVGGLWLTRQQFSQPTPQASVAQLNASPAGANSSSVPSSPGAYVPTQPLSNSASVPSTAQIASPSPSLSISQQEAVNLVDAWLQAKRVMFAPPYKRQIAADIATGDQYDKVAGSNGSIDWLESSNAYYQFGVQKIDGVDQFSANGNQATIQVRVTEDRTLYKNGKIDPNETDFKTRTVIYNLQLVDGRWKIASSKIIN